MTGSAVDSFERFCRLLQIEDGSPLVLEGWQREVLADVLGEARETCVLMPKSNGKTALLGALSLFHLVTSPDARVYVAAASRDQAGLMYGYAAGFVARSPDLESRLVTRPGYREIRSRRDQGFIKVLASDADTADGVGPTLALVDELHRHKNADLYAALRDGLGKRGGTLVTISTAGWDHESPLGMLRRAALALPDARRSGSHLRAQSDSGAFVLHEWQVPEGADTNDLAVVKRANPSSFVTG
jgi:phage terminase large subunit-like protein